MKTRIIILFVHTLLLTATGSVLAQSENNQPAGIKHSMDTTFNKDLQDKPQVKSISADPADHVVNAFTPNGDGINDIFMEGIEIRVFTRWGKEVFYGSDGWDGKNKGEELAADTYYYIRYFRDKNGDLMSTEKASVTLIRR